MFISIFVLITEAALLLLIGGFIGVGLGRRSETANNLYDRGRAELDRLQREKDEAEAELRIALAKLKDNGL